MGELLPTDIRARDDSPSAPGVADPSPGTTTPRDPSDTSPSVWPMPGAVAWAADGAGRAGALGAAAVAPSYDQSITDAATCTYVGGVMTGSIAPTTVGAMSAVGSPIRPAVSSAIAAITSCSVTSEAPLERTQSH